jgi:uncharacterized membrane protein YsdA (DUF1294 family)
MNRLINIISGLVVVVVFCTLIVMSFTAIDREMAARERQLSHNHIHRHDLIGGGRGR